MRAASKDNDRSERFEHYRTLASLKEYVLIAQDKPHVEQFVRQPDDRRLLSETNRLDGSIELASIGCSLSVSEIYVKVKLIGS